MMIIKFFELT